MSPEQQQINELKAQVLLLQEAIRTFSNPAQLDPQIASTITAILSSSSTKTSASATQAVNEAGAGIYKVMTAPSGFIKIGNYNVPYII